MEKDFNLKRLYQKGYIEVLKDMSTTTASRDFKKGVGKWNIGKYGTLNKTRYRIL